MKTRRAFLKTAGGTALALSTGCSGLAQSAVTQEWRNRQSGMSYRPLGKTGFMVSGVVMGGNEIRPENYDHVLRALDSGLNYLDTAPAYGQGESERAYAKVIKARNRDTFFLNSKVSLWDDNRKELFQQIFDKQSESEQKKLKTLAQDNIEAKRAADPDYLVNYFDSQIGELEAAALSNVMEMKYGHLIDRDKNYRQLILDSVDQSLTRLETDHLDILMCPHGASSAEELLNYPEIFEAFEILKKAGKVRHLGVSAHSDPAGVLEAAVKSKQYAVAMVACNIVNHRRLSSALKLAAEAQLGVISMKVARAVYPGLGRGEVDAARVDAMHAAVGGQWKLPQKAYLWALRHPHISATVSNMVNHDQVKENMILPQVAKEA
ncbi:MAG: aldo/keto reductase [Planctomycetes bacterium]|nr:aldo/keto reductase [Planctomycetota bacterium]